MRQVDALDRTNKRVLETLDNADAELSQQAMVCLLQRVMGE